MATYPLRLPGWEDRSVIRSDYQLGGWFAQLWPNGSTSDPPEAWLTALSPTGLAAPVADATRTDAGKVETAISQACGGSHRAEWWQRE